MEHYGKFFLLEFFSVLILAFRIRILKIPTCQMYLIGFFISLGCLVASKLYFSRPNHLTTFSGGGESQPSRLFPQTVSTNIFSKFTKLQVPETLEPPLLNNVPPMSSIMPHMTNYTLRKKLGNAAWHLIHTMGNTYPKNPTKEDKFAMVTFLRLLGILYPCGECASHLREKLKLHPPENYVESRANLTLYLCRLHNRVNIMLNHEIFDCAKVSEMYQCGCNQEQEVVEGNVKERSLFPEDFK